MKGRRQIQADQEATLYELYAADYGVYPSLAQSWEVADGGTTIIFNLVDAHVHYHNGDEMTSEDIKWSIDTMVANEYEGVVGSPYAGDLLSKNITGVETPDEKTVVVRLSKPTGYIFD